MAIKLFQFDKAKCLGVCISSKESHSEFAAHSINICISEHINIKFIISQSLFPQISEDEVGTNSLVEMSHEIPGSLSIYLIISTFKMDR